MDLITTQNRDTSLCSDVLLRACPKNDSDRRVNFYINAFNYFHSGMVGNDRHLRVNCYIIKKMKEDMWLKRKFLEQEQIVHCNTILYRLGVCIVSETIRCNHRQMNRLFTSGANPESLNFLS